MKNKKGAGGDEAEARGVVPFEFVAEVPDGKYREDGEGNDFLNRFELRGTEFVGADAVGGDLETVFEEGDAPTGEDDFPEGFAAVFEVAVPGEGHEDVGDGEQDDGAHRGKTLAIRCGRFLTDCDVHRANECSSPLLMNHLWSMGRHDQNADCHSHRKAHTVLGRDATPLALR